MTLIDNEILILEVEKHPCLYNLGDEKYKNRAAKFAAWADVSKGVVGGKRWKEMDQTEKSKTGKDCQIRWRYLRDAFIKALKNQNESSRSAAQQKRRYVYQQQMSFLIPTLQCRQTSMNTDDTKFDSSALNSRPTSFRPSLRKRKDKSEDQFESQVLDMLKKNTVSSTEDQHPDKLFLLSLFPKVSKIDESKKLQFQIETLQLLQKFTDDTNSMEVPSDPIPSLSQTRPPTIQSSVSGIENKPIPTFHRLKRYYM